MGSAAMHIARTGLDAQDTRMRVISNNLANVNTTAFKHDRAIVRDARPIRSSPRPAPRATAETQYATGLEPGHRRARPGHARGSRPRGRSRPPATRSTWRSTAMAISRCSCPAAGLGYTRAGNFTRSAEGQLVTAEGYQVMPGVTIPEGATAVTVGSDGTVSAHRCPGPDRGRARSARSRCASFPIRRGSRRSATTT